MPNPDDLDLYEVGDVPTDPSRPDSFYNAFLQEADEDEIVDVYIRGRRGRGETTVQFKPHSKSVSFPDADGEVENFNFDGAFPPETSQPVVYKSCLKKLVGHWVMGDNICFVALGDEGTGKTFSVEGGEPTEQQGVLPSAVFGAWNKLTDHGRANFALTIKAAAFSGDGSVTDLYAEGKSEDPVNVERDRVFPTIKGATPCKIADPEQIFGLMKRARDNATPGTHIVYELRLRNDESRDRSSDSRFLVVDTAAEAVETVNQVIRAKKSKGTPAASPMASLLDEAFGGRCRTICLFHVFDDRDSLPGTRRVIGDAEEAFQVENERQVSLIDELNREAEARRRRHETAIASSVQAAADRKFWKVMRKMEQIRMMRNRLLRAHQGVEYDLTVVAKNLRDTLVSALGEVNELHQEIARKDTIHAANMERADAHRSEVKDRLDEIKEDLDSFRERQAAHHEDVAGRCEDIKKRQGEAADDISEDLARVAVAVAEQNDLAAGKVATLDDDTGSALREIGDADRARADEGKDKRDDMLAELQKRIDGINDRLDNLRDDTEAWKKDLEERSKVGQEGLGGLNELVTERIRDLKTLVDADVVAHQKELDDLNEEFNKALQEQREGNEEDLADLLVKIEELVNEMVKADIEKTEVEMTKQRESVASLTENTDSIRDGVLERIRLIQGAREAYLMEDSRANREDARAAREESEALKATLEDLTPEVQSKFREHEAAANAHAGGLISELEKRTEASMRHRQGVVRALDDSTKTAVESTRDLAATSLEQHRDLSESVSAICSVVERKDGQVSNAFDEYKTRTVAELEDLREDTEVFVKRTTRSDAKEAIPAAGPYDLDRDIPQTAPYATILAEYRDAWAEEVAVREQLAKVRARPSGGKSTTTTKSESESLHKKETTVVTGGGGGGGGGGAPAVTNGGGSTAVVEGK